jgi:hypothetical protein
MKKFALAVFGLFVFAVVGYAITVNPASNVTADSEATALTIPYRDSNGSFSVAGLTDTGNTVIQGQATIGLKTSTQLSTLVPAASGYLVVNITKPALCISTGTNAGAWVIVSSKTAAGGAEVSCALN